MRLGLISDTHLGARLRRLPSSALEALSNSHLILHAGDVGDLRALDELGEIAPVIAVHRNDESQEASRELPYQQLIHVQNRRILLWHSHLPDRIDELAFRQGRTWPQYLTRSAERARRAGAKVVVQGHMHVPLAVAWDGVPILCPGALASPNAVTRQTVRSVASLTVDSAGGLEIIHRDIDAPARPVPAPDLDAPLPDAFTLYIASLLEPALRTLEVDLKVVCCQRT